MDGTSGVYLIFLIVLASVPLGRLSVHLLSVASPSNDRGSDGVPLAELVACLSLATDLGLGQPMEHVARSSLLGLRLADDLELDLQERRVVYYVGLLASVGCHADSYEQAALFGDDIAARAAGYEYDQVGFDLARFLVRHVGAGRPPWVRARALASFAVGGIGPLEQGDLTHCLVAGDFAMRLGLDQQVHQALQHCFERWDGRGHPNGIRGEELAISARIFQVADIVVGWHRLGGVEAAIEVARARQGGQFDPGLVDVFCRQAEAMLTGVDAVNTWKSLVEAEPSGEPTLTGPALDHALEAVADFADLKSPYFSGHSRGVSRLAGEAASISGLSDLAEAKLRRAGLLVDLGRLGVSNAIWDKEQPLAPPEWERIRLHPYLGERILAQSPALAGLGELAAFHHERLDGSGYPRGLSGESISVEARLLAAADCYQALVEPRPYRPAHPADDAEAELRLEVRGGRIDGEAADAVLSAAGHRVRRRRQWPAGLTPREVEVLRLIARGASNKEIAHQLVISPKTAGTHIEHIYLKTGANSRATVAMFAMKHGLLEVGSTTEGSGEYPMTGHS